MKCFPPFERLGYSKFLDGPGAFQRVKNSHWLFFILLCLGSFIGWHEYRLLVGQDLPPDAQTYLEIVKSFSWSTLYQTGMREPVWIWLLKVSMQFFGYQPQVLRILGLVLFLFSGTMLYFLIFRYTRSFAVASVSMGFYFCNLYMVDLAASGLRDIGFIAIFLALAALVLDPDFSKSLGMHLFLTSLTAMLLSGMRINSLVLLLLLIPWLIWRYRVPFKYAVIPFLSALLFIGPYLKYCQDSFQDPFYSANIHARWWRNYEFVLLKEVGCEGCPSAKELETSMYGGAPVTAFHYIFGMRSLPSLIAYTGIGYVAIYIVPVSYFKKLLGPHLIPGYPFFLYGLYLVLVSSKRWIMVPPLILMNFIPFTALLNMDPRIFSPLAPFHSFILAVGVTSSGEAAYRVAGAVTRFIRTRHWGELAHSQDKPSQ